MTGVWINDTFCGNTLAELVQSLSQATSSEFVYNHLNVVFCENDEWKHGGYTNNPNHINHFSNKPYKFSLKIKFQSSIHLVTLLLSISLINIDTIMEILFNIKIRYVNWNIEILVNKITRLYDNITNKIN